MSSRPDDPDKPTDLPQEDLVAEAGAPSVSEDAPQASPRTENPPSGSSAAHRPSTTLGVFLLLLLLLAFANAGGAYWLWQKSTQQAEQIAAVESTQDEAGSLAQAQAQDRDRLVALESLSSQQNQELLRQQAAQAQQIEEARNALQILTAANTELRSKVEGGATAWRLDAVEQLLLTANERLLLAGDAQSAEQALALADSRLQAVNDPAWVELRRIIADEMAALRAVPKLDATAISLKLQALADRAPSLPLAGHLMRQVGSNESATRTEEGSPTESDIPWYDRLWLKTQQAVMSLVTIRQNTTPTAPLLPPDMHGLLVQNLRLQLEAARTALLLRDAAQFQNALRTSSDWVERYLNVSDPSVEAAVATLAELRRVDVNPTPPDISASLRRLRQLRASY